LSRYPIGINRIYNDEIPGFAKLAHHSQRVVKVAINSDNFRSVGKSLHQLSARDFSRRQYDDAQNSCTRRVCSR
jgi:hypothetical protein